MSGKIIITNYDKYRVALKHDGKNVTELDVSRADEQSELGNIYIGRVTDVVKNLNAAFIEYSKGKKGYFSLDDNKDMIFLNNKNTDKVCQGDTLLVRVTKEALKTKAPVLSSKLELAGEYIVLTSGDTRISFSSKLKDDSKKKEIEESLRNEYNGKVGFIIRTKAGGCSLDMIISEAAKLYDSYTEIIEKAKYLTPYTRLYNTSKSHEVFARDLFKDDVEEILTDDVEVYNELKQSMGNAVRLYNDPMLALDKLYNVESFLEKCRMERVWLDSGAYLIIEHTEALWVIDVNTGKCVKGKNNDKVFYKVNKEAAYETARQIRLRNMSGMIIIDFINMKDKSLNDSLIEDVKQAIMCDRIKTTFVDVTKLGLVELTRKKERPPLHEILK